MTKNLGYLDVSKAENYHSSKYLIFRLKINVSLIFAESKAKHHKCATSLGLKYNFYLPTLSETDRI